VLEAFAREVVMHPNAAHLVLVEARHAGPVALASVNRTTLHAERLISWSLREDPVGPAPALPMVRRIVADGARLVRARLLDGGAAGLAHLAADLSVLCCASGVISSTPSNYPVSAS
jgi:hypothetical protein